MVQIGDQGFIKRMIEREQSGLMGQELADSDLLFSILRKLGPVMTDELVVIEPASRMGHRESHSRETFSRGVDERHRVLFPGCPGHYVSHATPQINDLFSFVIHATGSTDLSPVRKILGECCAHFFVSAAYKSMYRDLFRRVACSNVLSLLDQYVSCARRCQTYHRLC